MHGPPLLAPMAPLEVDFNFTITCPFLFLPFDKMSQQIADISKLAIFFSSTRFLHQSAESVHILYIYCVFAYTGMYM